MAITTTVPDYTGNTPVIGQPQPEFNQNTADIFDYIGSVSTSINDVAGEMNSTATQVSNDASSASSSAASAAASADEAGAFSAGIINFAGDFVVGVTSAVSRSSYRYDGGYWTCVANTTSTPSLNNSAWRKVIGQDDIYAAEERAIGAGVKIYHGSNGSYVENGNTIPNEDPPYTHLAVPINGKVEDVAMSPIASGSISSLTETGATIGATPVIFYQKDQGLKIRKVNFLPYYNSAPSVAVALQNLSSATQDFDEIDFNGLTLDVAHLGVNFNPFVTGGDNNQTCYAFFEKKNYLKLSNATFNCSLDMTSNSLVLFGFAGCLQPVFDNIHVNVQCSGTPSFDANGYETFASIITHKHHEDGTQGSGFIIRNNCSFRINHQNGGSIGAQESNPVHDYSGKIVGVESWGDITLEDDGLMKGNIIEVGTRFWDCTARCVWMWHTADNDIKPFFDNCGKDATEFCNYGIRVTHRGSNSEYVGKFECGWYSSASMLVSNNNSLRTPKNVTVKAKAKDVDRFMLVVNAGINVDVDGVHLENCGSDYAHVRFIEQTNSEWSNCKCWNVSGKNCWVDNVIEGSGLVYNSADNDGELDIGYVTIDGITANGGITQRLHSNKVHHSKVKNASNYGMYHGTGISPIYEDNEVTDCPNNWGIGGFADANVKSRRNAVERCGMGIRTGVGDSLDDVVRDCAGTHIEVRQGSVRNYTIEDGSNTVSGSYAIVNAGSASKLIGYGLIENNNSNFAEGIRAPLTGALLIENGVFGTYSSAPITNTAGLIKRDNYDESGAVI